jgi:hypothetical protein
MRTTQNVGLVAVISQRDRCDWRNFWDIRMVDGRVLGELDDGSILTAITGNTQVADDQWHTVTLARVGAKATLYVDGREDGSSMAAAANLGNLSVLMIGQDVCGEIPPTTPGYTAPFFGGIDEVMISSK